MSNMNSIAHDALPEVWGEHYWYFIHSVTFTYPDFPTTMMKKQYYNLVMNMPLFIPHKASAKLLNGLLDECPVTPHLENRESFIKWGWNLHNRVNEKLGKPLISLDSFYISQYKQRKPPPHKSQIWQAVYKNAIFITLLLCGLFVILRRDAI